MNATLTRLDPARFGAPSFWIRAFVSIALLVGFYLSTLAIVVALLLAPVLGLLSSALTIRGTILSFIFGWIPAMLLAQGVLHVRTPSFKAPGRRVLEEDAPELFTILGQLASDTGTMAPAHVYVVPLPDLAVTHAGGFLGFGGRRVLVIGAPLLETLTVGELRAGLAHEYGHFAFGDTRLLGLLTYAESAFRSVLESVERSPFKEGTNHYAVEGAFAFANVLGDAVVKAWGKLYLRATLPLRRRAELAADRLAAFVAGKDAAERLLEAVHLLNPLYVTYLTTDVARAARAGVFPSDLAAGYRIFFERKRELGMVDEARVELRTQKTEPLDSHPAFVERLACLTSAEASDAVDTPLQDDARSAMELFRDAASVRAGADEALRARFDGGLSLEVTAWSDIARGAFDPMLFEDARRIAEALHPQFPKAHTLAAMFAAVVAAYESSKEDAVIRRLDPGLVHRDRRERAARSLELAEGAATTLFRGALLEAGGRSLASLGEDSLLIRFEDEDVDTAGLIARAMRTAEGREPVSQWARRLSSTSRAMRTAVG